MKKKKTKTESNFQRGFEQHHDFPSACICSAEGWVCDNPPALQFVGTKHEVSLVIKALFGMRSGPGEQQSGTWKAGTNQTAPLHVGRE